jgi:hypothetical protein
MKINRGTRIVAVAGMVAGLAGCFGEGTTLVGSASGQVKPGLYTAAVPAGGMCLWERLRDLSGQLPGIITDALVFGGRQFLQVLPSDKAIRSNGCGFWVTPKSISYNPNRATAKQGQYRIPTDLLPGTYAAPGGSSCYWERLSAWTGETSAIIAHKVVTGRQTMTISATDVGFLTSDCGNWTRIGP